MTVLKGLKELKGGVVILRVLCGGELVSYYLRGRNYRELGEPVVGEVLDHVIDGIIRADEEYRAEKKALSLLSYADNNQATMYRKLVLAGFAKDISKEVTEEMVRLGYINEREQVERLVKTAANTKLLGRAVIIPKLCAKGYSPSLVREVLDTLIAMGEISFSDNKKRLIETKLGDSPDMEEVKKLLYKYGYSSF